jgi:hypothetical protein
MVRIRLPPQPPGFATPAAWADKPVRPARRYQISSAGRLIAEALLELNQGARKIGHRGHRGQLSSRFVLTRGPPSRLHHFVPPDAEG